MNITCLTGNLGRDPETRFTQGGLAVCNFSLATTKHMKGEKKTSWHNIVCFGKTAENAQAYLFKGSKCAIVGEISYSDYEKDGVKRYKTDIIANNIEFLDSKQSGQQSAPQSPHHAQQSQGNNAGNGGQSGYYTENGGNAPAHGGVDDVPF